MLPRRGFCLGVLAAGIAPTAGRPALSKEEILAIDTHAHVFARDLPLTSDRRYAPAYDATLADYLGMLDRNGMSHGVLVQPSFLGMDNTYMLEALRREPRRLRGIAVVAPETAPDELRRLDRAGIVGLRLNLIGQPDPDLTSETWQRHLAQVAVLGWQIEVHAEARRLPLLLKPLLRAEVSVVVDHFGRPDPRLGTEDPGFRDLLTLGATRRVWVKLSAAYRNGTDGAGERTARAAVPLLRDAFGLDRLVWGSDWPHTQFEKVISPAATRHALDTWLPDPAERRIVLADTPARLFRLSG
jgi:predicted TIM-barrel fold metal-dependent hydrolase